jgi:Spy/CpxP family protein refolding chaperone
MAGVALAAVGLAVGGGVAVAHGHHDGMRGAFGAHLEDLLRVAKATPEQRQAIEAARDHVIDTVQRAHKDERLQHERALTLFEADRIDPKALAELRSAREAHQAEVGDAITLAVETAHDALKPAQRKAVAAEIRAQGSETRATRHLELARHFLGAHVDDVLDAANATADQRKTIHASVDRALAVIAQNQKDHAAAMKDGASLFEADKLDRAKLDAFRTNRQSEQKRAGDAIVDAIVTAHDTLTPAQRKTVTTWVRTHRPRFGHDAGDGG